MLESLLLRLRDRPWWMNALLVYCGFMAAVFVPADLFLRPLAGDVEVWLGVGLTGWWAKVGAIAHWWVYVAGTYGFWRMRSWMWPWAAAYAAQVAGSTFAWSALQTEPGLGWLAAPATAAPFAVIAVALWNARDAFQSARATMRARYGEWALVTGASSGVGTAFARSLARDGMSCVLTGRDAAALQGLAKELTARHGIATRQVVADLSTNAGLEAVVDAARGLDMGVVVLAAGGGYAGSLARQDATRLRSLTALQCVAPVSLLCATLPGLLVRGRGAIFLLSASRARAVAQPHHAVYGATMAFASSLGEALWAELDGSGIDVLVVAPERMDTRFDERAGVLDDPSYLDPAVVADDALADIGRGPTLVSGWRPWFAGALVRRLPASLGLSLAKVSNFRRTRRELR